MPASPYRSIRGAFVLAAFAATLACGSEGPTDPATQIRSVSIETTPRVLRVLGDSLTLDVRVENGAGEVMAAPTITWTSSAPAVASARSGVVVAKANGSALITATAGGRSDTATVTVSTVGTVTLSPARPTLASLGDTVVLAAEVRDHLGHPVNDGETTWASSSPAVATVERGIVVARTNGIAVITASVAGVADTTTITVHQRAAKITFVTQPTSQVQGHAIAPVVEVAVEDARGARLAVPTDPIVLSISVGTLTGSTSRAPVGGVARYDGVIPSEPSRAARLTARLGDLTTTSAFFEVQLGLALVDAGGVHTCGLTREGVAYCWGYAERTGDGSTTNQNAPVRVSGTTRYGVLRAGSSFNLAQTADGGLVTWGMTPTAFTTTQSFASIAAGWHSCGITPERLAYCWGASASYFGANLPDDTGERRDEPTRAMGGMRVSEVAIGIAHTCAIAAADSTAWCAGNNPNGELGDGTTGFATAPVKVAGGLKFTAIGAGDEFSCGLTSDGEVFCWGRNEFGQLGDPAQGANSSLPRLVTGGRRFEVLTLGGAHACGLTADGTAYCWGRNYYGALGNAQLTELTTSTPVAVSGGLKFDVISAGGYHTCGVARTGVTYCWGDFSNGATGAPPTAGSAPIPITAPAP